MRDSVRFTTLELLRRNPSVLRKMIMIIIIMMIIMIIIM